MRIAQAFDSNSEYFKLISAAKIKNISIEEEFNSNMYSEDLDFEIVKILKLELDNRKEAFKLVDFNDMIQKFIDRANDLCPTFDVVFIDEVDHVIFLLVLCL